MIDLTQFFKDAGDRIVAELRSNIRTQRDIEGAPFSRLATSTLMARQRAKGLGRGLSIRLQTKATKNRVSGGKPKDETKKSKTRLRSSLAVNIQRLMNTNRFHQFAFYSIPTHDDLVIGVSRDDYAEGVTFKQIVHWNNRGDAKVNRNIVNPPLIFPNTLEEAVRMKSVRGIQRRFEALAPELMKQISRDIPAKITVNLQV
jgi:hypothetical protein